jgi:uncharacterized repeat protein (TIGR03803 family)/VCBS repeat-containing protein
MSRNVHACRLSALLSAIFFLCLPRATSAQVVEVFHSFSGCVVTGCTDGDNGSHPRTTLAVAPDGTLFGNTYGGGSQNGLGTLFKVGPTGSFTRLFTFGVESVPPAPFVGINGYFPTGSLAYGSADGAFHGVTASGGQYGDGALFNITANGTFTKIHDFDVDGVPQNNGGPWGGLVQGPDGRFYGTSQYGGTVDSAHGSEGFVFRLESDGTITVLHDFNGSNGQWPQTDLMLASDGNLYGATMAGGGGGGNNCSYNGCGTIFRVVLPVGTVETIHAFGLADGNAPLDGHLTEIDGTLYGVTSSGGALANGAANLGTIFSLSLDGTFTSLFVFDGVIGCEPHGSLVVARDGNFYGTTVGCAGLSGANQTGTIFRMTADGTVTLVHTFQGPEGARPFGGLVEGIDGNLYGTAYDGGGHNLGVVFKLSLPQAQDGTLNAVEDTSADGTFVASDPNAAPLTFTIVSNGSKGTATLTNATTGAFTYTPNANQTGADSFTFRANNGTIDTNVATIDVSIESVNDAPVAQAGTVTTDEDIAAIGTLAATDVDSASLTYSIVTNGSKGSAVVTSAATGAFQYTPNANASGTDSFTYKTSDGAVESNTATIAVTITAVNDAPIAVDGTTTVAAGASVAGALAASDVENSSLTYAIVNNGTKGTAAIVNAATGAYTYSANAGSSGTDSFTFKANDGSTDSNTATVTVTITAGQCAADISTTVTVSMQSAKLNRKTGRYTQTITLKNADGTVAGPVSLVLDNLSSNATLFSATGTTACAAPSGSPYVNMDIGSDSMFIARERTSITLEFANPSGQAITYTPRILGGPASR